MFGLKRSFTIRRLVSGGLITNYFCSSQCGHCLYRCSPSWDRLYIDRENLVQNIRKIMDMGCRSVHVGGGEPFLNTEALKVVLETSASMGMGVEYVETNSSWFRDPPSAVHTLESLAEAGLRTLLISMSPFHNEYIPFFKVKGVLAACREVGIGVLPWIGAFYDELDSFDDSTTHKMDEFIDRYGPEYLRTLPSRYWIHLGGRALNTFGKVWKTSPPGTILEMNRSGCSELRDTNHFHVDLFGNYVPGLCAGLSLHRDDLGGPVDGEVYPFLTRLFREGVNGLFKSASRDFGFEASRRYVNKCDLCYDIRRFLVKEKGLVSKDLQPIGHYAR